MIFFYTLTIIFVFLLNSYLFNPIKETKKFIFFFFLISLTSFILYKKSGNNQSFFFYSEVEKEIQNLISNPNEFSKIDPKKIVIFLEEKLRDNPNDRDGWVLLARTCMLTGHNQKADLYYKKSLEYFPDDQQILYEYSILKKNTDQFDSALKLLFKIKKLDPLNLEARKLILEIFRDTNQLEKLNKEIIQIEKNKSISSEWLTKTILEIN